VPQPLGGPLGWALLVFLLPLAPVLGSGATILALLTAVILIPLTPGEQAFRALRKQPAILMLVLVFVALAAVFAITANDGSDLLFILNFISLPLALPVLVMASRNTGAMETITTIAVLCLGGALAAAVLAIGEVIVLNHRLVLGIGMGPRIVARIALVLAFMALAALLVLRSPWRLMLYAAPIFALLVVYLSGTRGAALAIPVIALIHVAFLLVDRRERRHGLLIGGLALASLLLLALGSGRLAGIGAAVLDLLTGTPPADGAVDERVRMLETAWRLFLEKPVFGHGWGNFAEVAQPLLGNAVHGGLSDRLFQFHSDSANFAVSAGVVGLICWAALLLAPLVGAFATPRDAFFRLRLYCCLQLGASYFVFGLTDLTLGYDLPTTLYVFLTAIVLGAFREGPADQGSGPDGAALLRPRV
jgi:O-antigen ligase